MVIQEVQIQAGDGQTEVENRANRPPIRKVFEENRHPDKSHARICGAVLLHDFKNTDRRHFWMVAAFRRMRKTNLFYNLLFNRKSLNLFRFILSLLNNQRLRSNPCQHRCPMHYAPVHRSEIVLSYPRFEKYFLIEINIYVSAILLPSRLLAKRELFQFLLT